MEALVLDLLMVVITIVFFAATIGFVVLCQRLMENQ